MAENGLGILYPDTEFPKIPVKHWRLWDISVNWKDINPGPDVYDFTRLDQMVALGESRGTKDFCLVLGMTPRWAAKDPTSPHSAPWIGMGTNSPPRDQRNWDEYVVHTVNRYKGRIKYYQIWNEPQLADFWYPYTDIATLGRMTANAYRLIRIIDPSAKVVAAPVLPRPSSGGMRRAGKYLDELKKHKWPVDIYAAHIYPEVGRGPDRWRELGQDWIRKMREMKAPKKPFWVTETNYNLLGGPLPSKRQVENFMRETNRICDQIGISRNYWYAYGTHTLPNVFGIRFTEKSQGTLTLRSLT
jgi:hypothetical protein